MSEQLIGIPERALLLAILHRAVEDAICDRWGIYQHIRREARYWLLDWREFDRNEPFTFPWICIHLDLDPEAARETILQAVRAKKELKLYCSPNGALVRLAADESPEYPTHMLEFKEYSKS